MNASSVFFDVFLNLCFVLTEYRIVLFLIKRLLTVSKEHPVGSSLNSTGIPLQS